MNEKEIKNHVIKVKKKDLDYPEKILEIITKLFEHKLAYGFCILWSEDLTSERLDFLFGELYENRVKFTVKGGYIRHD